MLTTNKTSIDNYLRLKRYDSPNGPDYCHLTGIQRVHQFEHDGSINGIDLDEWTDIVLRNWVLKQCPIFQCKDAWVEGFELYSAILPGNILDRICRFEVLLDGPRPPIASYYRNGVKVEKFVPALHHLQNLFKEITRQELVVDLL